MNDNVTPNTDYDFGFDSSEYEISQADDEFLRTVERDQVSIAQLVNNQQSKMADNFFHGSTMLPTITHDEYVQFLVSNSDQEEFENKDSSKTDDAPLHTESKNTAVDNIDGGLGIKYHDIEYRDGDLLPSIKPSFIKQYYLRFITNICINLVTNPTVRAVNKAQSKNYHKQSIVPSMNLVANINDDLDSKLAQSIFSDVKRHENESESRRVYWHIPKISKMVLNNRILTTITQHDVILPIYDNILRECSKQMLAHSLLAHYKSLYMKLPLTTREYSDDFDPHYNPQYVKKLTSLQQSINFLKTSSWYLFSGEINSLFTNKRRKPLSYARGYLLTLARHYNNDEVVFNEKLIKRLGEQVDGLRYWVENANNAYLNLSSSQPQISKRYAHHTITSHQLGYEVLSMLSKPIVKNEPLNNLNYDLDNGILYLAGMNEVLKFWVKKLSVISEDDSADNANLRNSILKTASKKARTFYPPSALYLED
ncbi:MAG: hypothetical protein J6N72_02465 [Psychrobacter sp.]|nr:hypothetical protein [Psychrobacter sp.]